MAEIRNGIPWRRWGPYLSERQWGTVREDYSRGGTAWDEFSHDHARSRAYRWGEDGIAGISDERQLLCLAVALWNGRDPILKERLFGLTNSEGNHGEDVKELYYYLDSTPTHSWMRMLYKYPQREFPYEALVKGNRERGPRDREFELIDTGIFNDDRYFDVEVEYAKAGPAQILVRITAHNRGPEAAEIHVLPHAWFRNTWSWEPGRPKPSLAVTAPGRLEINHPGLGPHVVLFDKAPVVYCCENETNTPRLYGVGGPGPFKDGIHERVVHGRSDAVAANARGTKAAAHYTAAVPSGGRLVVRALLHPAGEPLGFDGFDAVFARRREEADAFYGALQKNIESPDERAVQRQALAGMLWSKQFFAYDVRRWLRGDPAQPPPPPERAAGRNADWKHFEACDVLSMPDKWEYPWFAAWDLAFHCVPLAMIDAEFAKQQLLLLTNDRYMHPNGQLPAYEWAFGDVNPPVHAWSSWRVFQADRLQRGDDGDLRFLETVFIKLLLNFTWWVNRKDQRGNNIFQGGFLGLDNIGIFDRSAPLPTGGYLDQSDGTSWMAMYSLNMMRIALELSLHDPGYEDIATKFFEHFLLIVEAMDAIGGDGLWDDADGFFYDWLDLPAGDGGRRKIPLRIRNMVGLIPLFAVQVLDPRLLDRLPAFKARLDWLRVHRPELTARVARWNVPGEGERQLLSIVEGDRLRAILRRMLDEGEFLAPHGVRALSREHRDRPFGFDWDGHHYEVRYTPGESDSGLFGGNSNWRGPVWMPVNYLLVESLHKFHHYYGDSFTIECPTGTGNRMSLLEVADEIADRLGRLFVRNDEGRRLVFGTSDKEQRDPAFRDLIQFYEYFDGETGRGIGASHQTGWTGLIAKLIHPHRPPHPEHIGGSGERD
ncbi:MAG: glucosidase [Planctomycetes bacterium]|nr:glucosidase [Planctomycetota bacterium]